MTAPTDWVPPAEEAAPEVPPPPADEVTTGPVAEAPASLPPVTEPDFTAPDSAPEPDPTSAGPAETPSAAEAAEPGPAPAGDVQVQEQVITAGNAAPATVERSVFTAAASAFHVLGHLEDAARTIRAEIQKHVPPEVLAAAETEALALLRGML